MDHRIYHGNISPDDFANELMASFNYGNYQVQKVGSGSQVAVQIATTRYPTSGGRTAITISMKSVEDGISIQIGQQAWLGVAASLGYTALKALKNPFSVLGRLDDIAQDIESLNLSDAVWKVIENSARIHNLSTELSEKLKRITCHYCKTANPVGEPHCIACGAPLGDIQPATCKYCGFTLNFDETNCPNCKKTQ